MEIIGKGGQRSASSSISNTKHMQSGRLEWGMNIVDRLFYLVTPIVVGICAFILVFGAKTATPSMQKDISCLLPQGFSKSQGDYAHTVCLKGNANLFPDAAGPLSLESSRKIDLKSVFPEVDMPTYKLSPIRLAVMAVLCFVPVVLWTMICNFDGSSYIKSNAEGDNSYTHGVTLFLWYLITKIGPVIVCVVILLTVSSLQSESQLQSKLQSVADAQLKSYNESIAVICQYKKETPTANGNRYFVGSLMSMLQVWMVGSLIAVAVNAVCVTGLSLLCLFRDYRIHFIKSNLAAVETGMCGMVERRLGTLGVLVAALAVRNGGGHQVRFLLEQILAQLCEEEEREDEELKEMDARLA